MASLVGGGGGDANTSGRDELKTQFTTREGTYQLVSAVDFSRTARPTTPYVTSNTNSTSASGAGANPAIRISFVQVPSAATGDEAEMGTEAGNGGSVSGGSANNDVSSPTATATGLQSLPQLGSPSSEEHPNSDLASSSGSSNHLFCFNMGKELLVYPFYGCKKVVDINKPVDKRGYKGTNPTCHHFNTKAVTSSSLPLLIGFSGGQIQYVDSLGKDINKLFNEERMIDKTRVTCIRWLPNSNSMFLVAHASGHLYLYNADAPCGTTSPHYQVAKTGPGYTVWNCKSKTPRNPGTRWSVGDGAINEFSFSPCGQYLAVVSQDGFLRIFSYDTLELVGVTRSYFGGLLCVCWSPDGNYVCVGGEDDLVTFWSFNERRVVARGQGHKSWVASISFDPHTTTNGSGGVDLNDTGESNDFSKRNSQGECLSPGCVFSCDPAASGASLCPSCANQQQHNNFSHSSSTNVRHRNHLNSPSSNLHPRNSVSSVSSRTNDHLRISSTASESNTRIPACYRVGSVGQDTQLCLWDLTEDVIKHSKHALNGKSRPTSHANNDGGGSSSRIINNQSVNNWNNSHESTSKYPSKSESSESVKSGGQQQEPISQAAATNGNGSNVASSSSNHSSGHSILSLRFGALGFGSGDKSSRDKDHKRNFSLGKHSDKNSNVSSKGGTNNDSGPAAGGTAGLGVNLEDPLKLIGTQACPRLDECPLLEPLVCKKISHERLTSLTFREESIVTACQDGIICTWARPGDGASQL